MSIYLEQAKKWLDSPKLDSTIRSELDTLIKYKDLLNIKDDTF